jgi:hypothetical protein
MTRTLTEDIKPYVEELIKADKEGDKLALQVISLYNMYAQFPEAGSEGLCRASFEEWLRNRNRRLE